MLCQVDRRGELRGWRCPQRMRDPRAPADPSSLWGGGGGLRHYPQCASIPASSLQKAWQVAKDPRGNLLHEQGHMPGSRNPLSLASDPCTWNCCSPQSPGLPSHNSGPRNLLFSFHVSVLEPSPCSNWGRIYHMLLCFPVSFMHMATCHLKTSLMGAHLWAWVPPCLDYQPPESLFLYPKHFAQCPASSKDFFLI